MAKPGLYSNIAAKRRRIAQGSPERMARPGESGRPTTAAFKAAAKTTKEAKAKAANESLNSKPPFVGKLSQRLLPV